MDKKKTSKSTITKIGHQSNKSSSNFTHNVNHLYIDMSPKKEHNKTSFSKHNSETTSIFEKSPIQESLIEKETKFLKETSLRHLNKITIILKLFEEIKKRIEGVKIEDKKLFDNKNETYFDNIFKITRDELVDLALMIRESESRIENHLKMNNSLLITSSTISYVTSPQNKSNNLKFSKSKSNDENDYIKIINDLKNKNKELLSEIMVLNENYMNIKLSNLELSNKFKSNNKVNSGISLLKSKTLYNFSYSELANSLASPGTDKEDPRIKEDIPEDILDSFRKMVDNDNLKNNQNTYLIKVKYFFNKLKKISKILNEKEDIIRNLTEKITKLENTLLLGETKRNLTKRDSLEEDLISEKVSLLLIYQYDTETWVLISRKLKEKMNYQWKNIKDSNLNINSSELSKIKRLHEIENLNEKLKIEKENITKDNQLLESVIKEQDQKILNLKSQIELNSKNLENEKIYEINKLRCDLTSFQKQNDKYKEEIQINLNQIQDLNEKLTFIEKENFNFLLIIKENEKKIATYFSENQKLNRTIEEFSLQKTQNESCELYIEEIKRLKEEINKIKLLNEQNQTVTKKNEENLKIQNSLLLSKFKEIEKDYDDKVIEIEDLLKKKLYEINSLKLNHTSKDNEILSLIKEKEELITSSITLMNECKLINEKLIKEQELTSKLTQEVENLKREISIKLETINYNEKSINSEKFLELISKMDDDLRKKEESLLKLIDEVTKHQEVKINNEELLLKIQKENKDLMIETHELSDKIEQFINFKKKLETLKNNYFKLINTLKSETLDTLEHKDIKLFKIESRIDNPDIFANQNLINKDLSNSFKNEIYRMTKSFKSFTKEINCPHEIIDEDYVTGDVNKNDKNVCTSKEKKVLFINTSIEEKIKDLETIRRNNSQKLQEGTYKELIRNINSEEETDYLGTINFESIQSPKTFIQKTESELINDEMDINKIKADTIKLFKLNNQFANKISSLKLENDDLINLNRQKEIQINLLKFEIDHLNENLKNNENHITYIETKIKSMVEINEEQAKVIDKLTLKCEEMEKLKDKEIKTIKLNNRETLDHKNIEFQNKIEIKEKEINLLKDEIKQLIENNKKIFKSPNKYLLINDNNDEVDDLKSKNNELTVKEILLSNMISSLKKTNKELASEKAEDTKKLNKLSKKMDELEKVKNELIYKNNNFELSIVALNEKIENYKKDLSVKDEIIKNKTEELIHLNNNLFVIQEKLIKDKNNQMVKPKSGSTIINDYTYKEIKKNSFFLK